MGINSSLTSFHCSLDAVSTVEKGIVFNPLTKMHALFMATTGWTSEKVFFDSPHFFEQLCQEIETAKNSIEMEFYIFALDSVGQKIIQSLTVAASNGARVRLVVDGVGSPEWTRSKILSLRKKGVFVRVYHPLSSMLSQAAWFLGNLNFAKFSFFISRTNQRNHRKLCVIDGRSIWLGSMNVTRAHQKWRETGARVEGLQVNRIRTSFDWVWRRSRGFSREEKNLKRWLTLRLRKTLPGNQAIQTISLVRLNLTPALRRRNRARMLLDIDRTQKKLWLVNPYFVPIPSVIRALRLTAKRGVDVRLMVPHKSDLGFMTFAIEAFYTTLIRSNIRVFEYLPTMIHSKVMILDSKAVVGSSNLNHRSLIHDYELDIELRSPGVLESLEKQFLLDSQNCIEITREYLKGQHFFKRIVGWLVLLMRYWI